MILNGIVARIMNVARFWTAGMAGVNCAVSASIEMPIVAAYIGSVMQALQKQAHAMRITALMDRAPAIPFLFEGIFLEINQMGRMNIKAPIRLENSPT